MGVLQGRDGSGGHRPGWRARRPRVPDTLVWAFSMLAACTGTVRSGDDARPLAGPPDATGAGAGAGAPVAGQAAAGSGGSGDDDSAPSELACAQGAVDTGEAPLRRLSRSEYALTLQHLFQLPAPPDVSAVPPEAERDGFTVHGALQTLSAQHLRAYLTIATRLADELLADDARVDAVIGCDLAGAACIEGFVERFGRLAFRRPLAAEERDAIVQGATADALDPTDRYRYAIEALLISPSFIYRPELGSGSEGLLALSGHELASRLAFGLLGRAPDADLLDLAADGTLDTPAGRALAVGMLAGDPQHRAVFASFFEQWLGFGDLITPKQPPDDWSEGLLDEMRAETAAVLERFAWSGPGLLEVLTTDTTELGAALATYYGLPAPAPDGTVTIPGDHPRAGSGLLTHASLLSQKSDGDRIAMRGNWLRRTFLCQSLEIPEEVAATFGERLVGLTHTEIVRERNSDPSCAGCHSTIDPIGVGLDRFDATGRFDPDYVVPDYGVTPALPGAPDPEFGSVAELARKLQAMPEVPRCLTERTFLFVHGREPEARDRCTIDAAEAAFVESGHDFSALVRGLLEAPAFAWRRAPEAAPAEAGAQAGGQP